MIGRVIVDAHEQCRRRSLFPGMIAEGLAQGVTADVIRQPHLFRGPANDAICLRARQRARGISGAAEDIGVTEILCLTVIAVQYRPRLPVQNDPVLFSRFALHHIDVILEPAVPIQVAPFQMQKIVNAQRGVQSQDDQCIISRVRFHMQVIFLKAMQVFRISYGLRCTHIFRRSRNFPAASGPCS